MAQYYEVVSQGKANSDQTHQFFDSGDNEGAQVRYILADDATQFSAQQLVLSSDQVMVLDGSQQQLQSVVIDQGHGYQPAGQQQQFGTLVQNVDLSNQSGQQIFFMENSNGSRGETVQAVVEQNTNQTRPIVLNHHMTTNPASSNTQLFQGHNAPRMLTHVRTAVRQTSIQLNQSPQSNHQSPLIRQAVPQQNRPAQSVPMRNMIRQPQAPMRFRPATPRPKQALPQQNMIQVSRPNVQQMPQYKNQMSLNRSMPVAQQTAQVATGSLLSGSSQKSASEIVQAHRMSQARKPPVEDELDDHDPAMNSTPGQVMCDYKKILEQRQQVGKHPILARLPGNVLVSTAAKQRQQPHQPSQQAPVQSQLRNDEDIRSPILNQTPEVLQALPQNATKKPRAPARPRNSPAVPKPPSAARQRNPKQPAAGPQQPFNSGLNRVIGPSDLPDTTTRFSPQQQQQQRFANQHQMHHQTSAQNGITTNQNMSASNASQSHMNYLITAPSANRPQQQRPLPSYVPSSQIQQIIENTPKEEEYSDSIRMLVLLESGEQRLITFTLPSEACTIQEILRQVQVPFTHETNIRVTEANSNGINYVVTVGNVPELMGGTEEEKQEAAEPDQQVPQAAPPSQNAASASAAAIPPLEPPKPVTPELPKLIPGRLAVCSACGYTGEDFNKCTRCARKLPENVKSIEAPKPEGDVKKSDNSFSASPQSKTVTTAANAGAVKAELGSKLPTPAAKKRVTKPKPSEPESVVISSDEEEDDKKPSKSVCDQWLNKLGSSISICPVTKEPSLSDIKKHVRKLATELENPINITLKCRTVRIGSYRFVPGDDVQLDTKCIIIKAPVIGSNNSEFKTIRLDRGDIVKVLICYNKALPVIFCYVNVGAAPIIREMLKLTKESGYYFDPIDEKDDTYRKITFLPDDPIEEQKNKFQELYGGVPVSCIEELTVKEANNILIKACLNDTPSRAESFSEIKEILMYPKEGQGRLSINTEDYVCLGVDQFLNDKIIDFYLKYLWENLPSEQQEKVHVFSTFFYKRLTTKPTKAARKSHPYESDPSLSAAEKRHCRVKNWTKRINLFEKDFIIVPINENAHWFLAIICFPGLSGPQTFDGNPYNPEPKPKKNVKSKTNTDTKKEMTIACDEPLLSDKDEAESDSDMCSDCSEESVPVAAPTQAKTKTAAANRPAIKQPCILIFDSLAGPSRSRVVATLRDYLTIEYKTKMDTERVFDKDTIKGSSCKVPQQNNFTDCGLYVLQYVEQFFNDPIKDYYIPIKGIAKWFDEITVTKKREDICNLLKELMTEAGTNIKILPEIVLPTLNGKVVERQEPERDQEPNEEEQEDMFTDIEDSEMTETATPGAAETETNRSDDSFASGDADQDLENSPIKPSNSSVDEKSDIVTSTVSQPIKPTLSETPRQDSNRDTLSYLKAKRIVRRKAVSDEPDLKKSKLS